MNSKPNYKKTLIACYLGFITQAITANFTPLLFLTFKNSYGISLELIALIPLVFYVTQLLVDLVAVKFADVIGYRNCVVASQIISALGLILMAFLPELFENAFIGILLSVVLYAIGSGLIEVLISPIVEACPFENKSGVMSILHSFYCWGAVGVILGSTLFFAGFGTTNWKILAVIWAVVPFVNTFNFLSCPIERLVENGEQMRVSQLLKLPSFLLMIVLMICAGASEATMAQWASAFTESALNVSKTIGDLAGPCLFAVFMGVARVFYAKKSEKLDLTKVMLGCAALCLACYLLASLSPISILSLIGCALCGLAVGLMWPGTISISSQQCPKGGTAMFAFLALAGDFGAAVCPAIVGRIADMVGGNLKIGLLFAALFPTMMTLSLILLIKKIRKQKQQ
ncbi:MAG: MFS transporter [Clostridia bacterium]|nr:MFS transporter [Clostridia bacterium]